VIEDFKMVLIRTPLAMGVVTGKFEAVTGRIH